MLATFVPERPGRNSPAPFPQNCLVGYSHVGGQLRIKINFYFCAGGESLWHAWQSFDSGAIPESALWQVKQTVWLFGAV